MSTPKITLFSGEWVISSRELALGLKLYHPDFISLVKYCQNTCDNREIFKTISFDIRGSKSYEDVFLTEDQVIYLLENLPIDKFNCLFDRKDLMLIANVIKSEFLRMKELKNEIIKPYLKKIKKLKKKIKNKKRPKKYDYIFD